MSDLISRRAAIAEFSCCELTPDGGIDANYAIDFLEQLPSAQQWIPVSERLPEEGVPVLVSAYGNITDGVHERGWWLAWGDRGSYEDEENVVDAWMPLPEPYKEEES